MLHGLLMLIAGVALVAVPFHRWRAGRGTRYGSVGLAVFATLWLAEVGLTVFDALAPERSAPRAAPTWTPRPLPAVEGQVAPREFAAGPSDLPTVLIVGDSFAAGQGVSDDDKLGNQLGRALGPEVRVLTVAEPGWNTADQLLAFGTLGARIEPDVVVWLFVYNDLGAASHPADDMIVRRGRVRRWPLRVLDALARIDWILTVEAATVQGYKDALAPTNPDFARVFAALADVAAACREAGVRPVFAPYPLLHALDRYPFADEHARLLASARDAGWDTVDLLPAFVGRDASALWASVDDHHPNAHGHALAAEVLARELAPVRETGRHLDCARLPVHPGFAEPMLEACRTGAPEALLRIAELGLEVEASQLPASTVYRMGARTQHLAVVAAAIAEGEGAHVLGERAAAVVRTAQSRRGPDPAPSPRPD